MEMDNTVLTNEPYLVQGFITCTYDTLVSVFGKPTEITNKKAVWFIGGESNTTIVGKSGKLETDVIYDRTDWSIYGLGENNKSFHIVRDMMNEKLGTLSKYLTRYDIVRFF